MSGADLWEDNYPHGTVEGYNNGCKGGSCPAGVEYGLSCKTAKAKSHGDFQYQKLAKTGASVPEIAEALGLIGTAPSAPRTKKPGANQLTGNGPKPPKPSAPPAPQPEQSVAGAPDEVATSADEGGSPIPEKYLPAESSPQARRLWDAAAQQITTASEPAANSEVPTTAPASAEASTAEIRAWARHRGYEIGSKGAIPKRIRDHYAEAHRDADAEPAADADTSPAPTDLPTADVTPADPAPAFTAAAATSSDDTTPSSSTAVESIQPDLADTAIHQAQQERDRARATGIRLEQELTHVQELLKQEIADGTSLAQELLNEVGKVIALEERLDRRTRERDEAETRALIAERATTFILRKWAAERADAEAAHALILDQARTINHLSDALAPARWTTQHGVKLDDLPAEIQPRIMSVDQARVLATPWPRT